MRTVIPPIRVETMAAKDEGAKTGDSQRKRHRNAGSIEAVARSRSEADWIVGMNATRAATIRLRSSAFQDGKIDADDYLQHRPDLLAEHAATTAALQIAHEHVERVQRSSDVQDAEQALWTRLADIRGAVVDGIGNARDLNALRLTVAQLFDRILALSADHPFTAHIEGRGTCC